MKAFILGTAGHVDHGKTTLIRALTGTDTDRWREEKERGLTIDIGFARLALGPEYEVGVVDVPGHRGFLKNMLTGSTGIDCLLLVVAADEGPMPQTREHLAIARLLGVRHGVVALSKTDRVTEEWRELASEAATEELRRAYGACDWAVVPVSATEGTGLEDLVRELRARAGVVEARQENDLFRMPVDRSFSVRGAGTVVTGTVWSGQVSEGESVRILPADRTVRVRAIQVHGDARPRVGAGRRCALALVGVAPEEVGRGAVVVQGDPWRVVRRLGVEVELLPDTSHGLEHGQRVRLFLGTGEVMARVLLADRAELRAGGRGWAVVETEAPLVARVRDRFILRFYSPVVTIGGGRVAELKPPPRWGERVRVWRDCLDGDPGTALRSRVALSAGRGLVDEALPIATGLSAPAVWAALERSDADLARIDGRCYARSAEEAACRAVLDAVRASHEETPRASFAALESVRASLSVRFSGALIRRAVEDLTAAGDLEVRGPGVRLPGHRARLSTEEELHFDAVRRAIGEGGLQAPWVGDLCADLSLDRAFLNDALRLLVEAGDIVAVTPEYYLSREAMQNVRRAVDRVFAGREVATPADFREELGVSRKYLIPVLEYLDRTGVTRRSRDGRVRAEGGSQST
ncbi:MAG: selenocysteine-specific translation elongation factor [Gemmatimonadota bacterium]